VVVWRDGEGGGSEGGGSSNDFGGADEATLAQPGLPEHSTAMRSRLKRSTDLLIVCPACDAFAGTVVKGAPDAIPMLGATP